MEFSSGEGYHVTRLARAFPGIHFWASEADRYSCENLRTRIAAAGVEEGVITSEGLIEGLVQLDFLIPEDWDSLRDTLAEKGSLGDVGGYGAEGGRVGEVELDEESKLGGIWGINFIHMIPLYVPLHSPTPYSSPSTHRLLLERTGPPRMHWIRQGDRQSLISIRRIYSPAGPEAIFSPLSSVLRKDGFVIFYGPFKQDEEGFFSVGDEQVRLLLLSLFLSLPRSLSLSSHTGIPELRRHGSLSEEEGRINSNDPPPQFNKMIQSRPSGSTLGLRTISSLDTIARKYGWHVKEQISMPKGNWVLVFKAAPV